MRENVPIARYSPVCNVLRQWKTSLILTYRVYRLYDSYSYKIEKTFKNEQRSKDAAAKKRPNTSGVGKIYNYNEDIYNILYLLITTPTSHTYTL